MDPLHAACLDVFGSVPGRVARLHGGDLSDVARVQLENGQVVVAKQGPMVAREARMLEAIAAAEVPVPQVLAIAGEVLFLEALDERRAAPSHWAKFGEDLARLHACAGDAYGWHEDYAFGTVMIYNAPSGHGPDRGPDRGPEKGPGDWPGFWAERRLLPFVAQMERGLGARLETLAGRLGELLPAAPAPGLLHGDLWSGNLLATQDAIHLIDPACYFGDGEVDLAMLNLFGGPGPGFAEGYGALQPGWETRRAVYSLFPALVHLRLFGAGYRAMVERFLEDAGA